MPTDSFVAKNSLNADDIAQVHELQDLCEKSDGYRVKFNWDAIADRNVALFNDFCWYDSGRLVGYAPLDDYEPEREATAAVHPDFRGRAISRTLIDAIRAEVAARGGGPLLLVGYRSNSQMAAKPLRYGAAYYISEFHMEAILTTAAPVQTGIVLADVTAANVSEVSRGLAIAFGIEHSRTPERLLRDMEDPNVRYFLPMLGSAVIGQIGVVREENEVYIRAVGIHPEYRRRGYGRQLLSLVVERMYREGHRRFSLDVETQNGNALSIYESCGFRESLIYDYFRFPEKVIRLNTNTL